jgi:hypothetical protein
MQGQTDCATVRVTFKSLRLRVSYVFQNMELLKPQATLRRSVFGRCSVQNLLSSRLLSKNLKIGIYRTIILPVVLYGCETWSLTLKEERRLRLSENRVLTRIFRPKRDEVTGEWRKLHNESLNGLYSLPNIVRVIKSRRMR